MDLKTPMSPEETRTILKFILFGLVCLVIFVLVIETKGCIDENNRRYEQPDPNNNNIPETDQNER